MEDWRCRISIPQNQSALQALNFTRRPSIINLKKSDLKKSNLKKSDLKKSDLKKSDLKKSDPATGTYALVLALRKKQLITVGKLGRFSFPAGYYIYVGSAFGPGRLRARIGRHLRTVKAVRWHIDYVRNSMDVLAGWYTFDDSRQECPWASIFVTLGGQYPVRGFGASDCSCESHLIHFKQAPTLAAFRNKSASKVHVL
jgi:Uri superfamily endonuclease